jgi:hypothetical protein
MVIADFCIKLGAGSFVAEGDSSTNVETTSVRRSITEHGIRRH